jgi:NADPH:quinone reductase-like Zn-dependent oxidoreductase
MGAFGAERVKHQPHKAPPRIRRGMAHRPHDPGVRHQEEHDVFRDEIRAEHPLGLGPPDQLGEPLEGVRALRLHRAVSREGRCQDVLHPLVGGLHGADVLEKCAKPRPRIRRGERVFQSRGVFGQLGSKAGRDQVLAAREAPVERRLPNPRALGDRVERRVEAAFGKHLARRGQDPLPIAFGVDPQGVRSRLMGGSWSWCHGHEDTTSGHVSPLMIGFGQMEDVLHLSNAIIGMTTMRAFVLPDFERQPMLADISTPEPGPGEVLVRVRAASVNGIDLSIASGRLQGMLAYDFPVVLGKDFAGTVEAVGAGVTGFAVGDRVFGVVSDPSPLSSRSFAEYLAVPAGPNLTRIPEGVDVAAAGVLGLAGTAALQAVDAIAPAAGETVLVSGATGGVGAYAVQLVAARGATVIATARPGEDAAFVRDLGASHSVDYTGDVAAQVRAIRPNGVAAVLHFAGDGAQLGALLVPGGRLASTLIMSPEQLPLPNAKVSSVFASPDAATLDRLAAEVAAGRLQTPIQRTYRLDEVGQAMADFAAGTRGNLAIAVD